MANGVKTLSFRTVLQEKLESKNELTLDKLSNMN